MIVNVDWWALLTSPHAIAHHPRADAGRWQTLLDTAGFEMMEHGTTPMTLHFLSRKRAR